MSLLRFFNPQLAPDHPKTVECMLKYGDSIAIGQGTQEFMQALLRDIGVEAHVTGWTMRVCRSSYYCEYERGNDWHDRWPLVWQVRIEVAEALAALPPRDFPFSGTDAFDVTSVRARRPADDATVTCLVISDFDGEAELEAAQRAVMSGLSAGPLRDLQTQQAAAAPAFQRSEVLGRYRQLQIDLGTFPGSFFAQGAAYAGAISALCKKMKGTVNFLDRV